MGCKHGHLPDTCTACHDERVLAGLRKHHYDVKRALRLAHERTEETQSCEEAIADLIRQLDEARARVDPAVNGPVVRDAGYYEISETNGQRRVVYCDLPVVDVAKQVPPGKYIVDFFFRKDEPKPA